MRVLFQRFAGPISRVMAGMLFSATCWMNSVDFILPELPGRRKEKDLPASVHVRTMATIVPHLCRNIADCQMIATRDLCPRLAVDKKAKADQGTDSLADELDLLLQDEKDSTRRERFESSCRKYMHSILTSVFQTKHISSANS